MFLMLIVVQLLLTLVYGEEFQCLIHQTKFFFCSVLFYTYLKKNNEGFIGDSQILWQLEKHLRNNNLIRLCILTKKVSVCVNTRQHMSMHILACVGV